MKKRGTWVINTGSAGAVAKGLAISDIHFPVVEA